MKTQTLGLQGFTERHSESQARRTAPSAVGKTAVWLFSRLLSAEFSFHAQAKRNKLEEPSQRRSGKRDGEKTVFWAVATPLCAAFGPPNGTAAGGRYRPNDEVKEFAPSRSESQTAQSAKWKQL